MLMTNHVEWHADFSWYIDGIGHDNDTMIEDTLHTLQDE